MTELTGIRIQITGIVQGVGFRPFVYGLAARRQLAGWVRNTSAGVDIELDGSAAQLEEFLHSLQAELPPLARIDSLQTEWIAAQGFTGFEIVHSAPIPGAFIPISPDVSLCADCRTELQNPADRRYQYPFINCTNCGPRFTIIEDIPYDRPKTTMAPFEMCPDCAAEYHDPLNRRFHAQPVACPVCGPQVWLEQATLRHDLDADQFPADGVEFERTPAILAARKLLAEGKILAIKGLGGFHLACDATNPAAVAELRRRKLRVDKPFALMLPDLATIEGYCRVSPAERELLRSRQRPIVLLERLPGTRIAPGVAPQQNTLGVMLPYTPLHELLFDPGLGEPGYQALVMTSGNLSEEPIAISNAEARQRLAKLADAFLLHDRQIRTRCDDSVVRLSADSATDSSADGGRANFGSAVLYPLRRSRGYAPDPLQLPWEAPQLLATGPELKNTFCLTKGRYAFLSHHIGDLENYETLQSYEAGVAHFERLFRVQPEALVYDRHPNYLATRYAQQRAEAEGLPALGVQHHHAHIAACLAEHGHPGDRPVIGVALDGTGYGDDGAIWGGEFLIADYHGYRRFAHLAYSPLPGGDAATRKPARIALAQLWQAGLPWDEDLPPAQSLCGDDRTMLRSMLANRINTPLTSSMGRLFDAVAALAGLRGEVNYEAQAAIELENLVDPAELGAYPLVYDPQTGQMTTTALWPAIVDDLRAGLGIPSIAARFHNGLAASIWQICQAARAQFDLSEVALSGGVWQNMTLLKKTIPQLERAGFTVYLHRRVPANDGGLALGQAAVGIHHFGGS